MIQAAIAGLANLLKPQQVAQILNVPVSWVYTQSEAGKLPSHKLGRYRRFDPEELAAWLQKQRESK